MSVLTSIDSVLSRKNMYHGSCMCGAIHLQVTGEIKSIIHCHCSTCRKTSGTAYATNGFVKASDLKIDDPGNKLGFYQSTEIKKRYFCTVCAAPVFSDNSTDPERVRLRLGILDTPISERPISHNFVSSKAEWDDLDDTLPRYDGYEPSRQQR